MAVKPRWDPTWDRYIRGEVVARFPSGLRRAALDIDDLIQIARLRVLANITRLAPGQSPQQYIRRAARSALMDVYRYHNRQKRRVATVPLGADTLGIDRPLRSDAQEGTIIALCDIVAGRR